MKKKVIQAEVIKKMVRALMSAQYHYSVLKACCEIEGDKIGLEAMSHPQKLVNIAVGSARNQGWTKDSFGTKSRPIPKRRRRK